LWRRLPFFGALGQSLIVGSNIEHHLLGFGVGDVFRHTARFLGTKAPMRRIIKIRPWHEDHAARGIAPPSLETTLTGRVPGTVVTGHCLKNNLRRAALAPRLSLPWRKHFMLSEWQRKRLLVSERI
jgi:hypothetical protein